MNTIELIKTYYSKRGLKYPDVWKSIAFSQTEVSEVYELLFSREGGFKRNHPENKPKFSKQELADELGDAIFMLIVAGIVEDVNPLEAMENKINRKLHELGLLSQMGFGEEQ